MTCASLAEAASGDLDRATAFLTFDDGFRDNFETALPLLHEYGFGAFVFVLPPLVDSGGALGWVEVAADRRRYPATMRSVTWAMLEQMKEGGFEVGSHTLTHPHLPELDDDALRDELWESRARIKERLGACDTLAYPFGEWSDRVAAAAADCGYRYAFSLPTRTGQRRGRRRTRFPASTSTTATASAASRRSSRRPASASSSRRRSPRSARLR